LKARLGLTNMQCTIGRSSVRQTTNPPTPPCVRANKRVRQSGAIPSALWPATPAWVAASALLLLGVAGWWLGLQVADKVYAERATARAHHPL
jgi:hypothetical protein